MVDRSPSTTPRPLCCHPRKIPHHCMHHTPALPLPVLLNLTSNFSAFLFPLPLLFAGIGQPSLPSTVSRFSGAVSTALPILTANACSLALNSYARKLASSQNQWKLCSNPCSCSTFNSRLSRSTALSWQSWVAQLESEYMMRISRCSILKPEVSPSMETGVGGHGVEVGLGARRGEMAWRKSGERRRKQRSSAVVSCCRG